jgi:dihydropyrimidine dehydrogenase (NAD+) subunit PreA
MSVDISSSIGGVKIRSPLGVASYLPVQNPWFPDTTIEFMKENLFQKWLDNGVGYLKTCTFGPELPFKYERLIGTPIVQVSPGVEGYYIVAPHQVILKPPEILPMIDALREMASKYDDVPLIASITATTHETGAWVETAKIIEDRGADLIELNTVAPCTVAALREVLPPEEAKWGSLIGTEPKILGPIVEAVVKAVKIPVGVKLTADAGYPGILRVLNECNEAGAKFVVMFHQTHAVAPPDIYNGGKGLYTVTDGWNPIGDMGGEWNSPHIFKGAALTSLNFPDLEIFVGGGVTKPEHIIQSIMLGARAVETLSGIFFHGNSFVKQSLDFLKNYMEKQGYKTLDDFCGIAVQYVKLPEEIVEKVWPFKFKAETDLAKCSGCGLCADTVCPASYMEGGFGKLDPEKCSGCGLCVLFCPEGARKLVPTD